MARIFISYRRGDRRTFTELIYNRLVEVFGEANIFLDVENIPAGENFVYEIDYAVSQCDVMLVVIGPDWLSIADDDGISRLDKPVDFVCFEIAIGLFYRKLVIPVLVEGAHMPHVADLPDSIGSLAVQNAALVRHHPDFRRDMELLVQRIQEYEALYEPTTEEEARLFREHRRELDRVRRESYRQQEGLAAARDFAGLYRLQVNLKGQLDDLQRAFEDERQERRRSRST